jgi:hypothetical protein
MPLLVGLIGLVTEGLLGGAHTLLPEWLAFTGAVIGISILYGGIQYAVALRIVWTRIDFERTGSWIVGVLWLPIIFTFIQVVSIAVIFAFQFSKVSDLQFLLLMGVLDLGLGYGYVAVWLAGLWVIRLFQRYRKGSKL